MSYKFDEVLNKITVCDSSGNVITTWNDSSTTGTYPYIDATTTTATSGYIDTGITGTSAWAPFENYPDHLDMSPNGEFLIYDTPYSDSYALYHKNESDQYIKISFIEAHSKSQEELFWVYSRLSEHYHGFKIKYNNTDKEFYIG